jgi:hypothetical protein
MSGMFTDFWRIVKPSASKTIYNATSPEAAKLYSNFSWYTKVMKGASSRFSKYSQYKNMDTDVFVARALDTIAEEMTPMHQKTNLPFEIMYQNESNEEVPEAITMTVRAALRHWCDVQDLNTILFDIARSTIKYGDCFFRKTSDFKRWQYIDPGDIIGISIDDNGNPEHYHVRTGEKSKTGAFGDVQMYPAEGVVHFTLTSSMGDNGPFGESVLFACVKAFRHLSLLEDSVIIYRIVRAPERRVFFVDVGNMPPQRVKAYLEAIRNEMKQKRIPNESGGTDKVDSVYNPMSMIEDYFFAQTAEGRGSRVETLSGGENLGEIADLNFFQNKFLQGLRIPSSYMRGGADGGIAIADGKVGVAYIEELRFANYVVRLQNKINDTFDAHFKAYMKSAGLKVDPQLFKIKLADPQNFSDYKQAEVYEKLLGNYTNVKDDETLSVRYKQMHFLGMSEDDIQENEALLKQERCIPDGGIADRLTDLRMMYDKQWIENRPEIKVDDSYEDFTAESKQEDEATDEEEATTTDQDEDSGDKVDDKSASSGKDDEDKTSEKVSGGDKSAEESGTDEKASSDGDLGKQIDKL